MQKIELEKVENGYLIKHEEYLTLKRKELIWNGN
jgi:hypothetical protein